MELRRHVCRALHEDHAATMALLLRLEALLGRHAMDRPPEHTNADTARFVKELIRAVDAEIGPHFAFEEEVVFPLLAEAGEREMGEVLVGEHRVILPLAQRLAELARLARDTGFAVDLWAEFHEVGAALARLLSSHILKEDMGLLPALDDVLDDETDGRLAVEFAARR
ncbi:MAG TPA: hemerythrin domain-containing protein [Stellaceae bacterium]|nr:hemerythrin domain-containing protein [Stellaceae bacterium]